MYFSKEKNHMKPEYNKKNSSLTFLKNKFRTVMLSKICYRFQNHVKPFLNLQSFTSLCDFSMKCNSIFSLFFHLLTIFTHEIGYVWGSNENDIFKPKHNYSNMVLHYSKFIYLTFVY